ncbi:MAG TPA: type II toxin-antitoxin system HipA family toxin, partial [Taishania sp.]|nr:type II toxin-antitoxin system HipA family toxin [Taishania sp.]
MSKNQIISLFFKGEEIGRLGYDEDQRKSSFQYNAAFLDSGKYSRIFPYIIRRTKRVQLFTGYNGSTFRGLPPMIADSLPDMFGNIVFKEWLEATHREFSKISPLEQLTYIANRGMGALEFLPAKEILSNTSIDLTEITEIVQKVLDVKTSIQEKNLSEVALLNIFKIGSSAGGARPKVLVSEHKETGMLIPGDIEVSDDYHHYLIKLGIEEENSFGRELIEYVYYTIATALGIEMMPSKLIDNKHFATLRFDRQHGMKIHTLTASGLTGWDFEKPEHSSYENLFKLALDLKLPHSEVQQLYKRMVFNVVFAVTDDHLKNFSFMYDDANDSWSLAPAYDLTYAYNPFLNYTRKSRALSIGGKRVDIDRKDLLRIAEQFTIKNPSRIIDEVVASIPMFAERASE